MICFIIMGKSTKGDQWLIFLEHFLIVFIQFQDLRYPNLRRITAVR